MMTAPTLVEPLIASTSLARRVESVKFSLAYQNSLPSVITNASLVPPVAAVLAVERYPNQTSQGRQRERAATKGSISAWAALPSRQIVADHRGINGCLP